MEIQDLLTNYTTKSCEVHELEGSDSTDCAHRRVTEEVIKILLARVKGVPPPQLSYTAKEVFENSFLEAGEVTADGRLCEVKPILVPLPEGPSTHGSSFPRTWGRYVGVCCARLILLKRNNVVEGFRRCLWHKDSCKLK